MRLQSNSLQQENIAVGKPAKQSSLSRWTTKEGAGAAVNGRIPADFAFHTAPEDAPWWELDLESPYPLDRIVIHNRKSIAHQSRARTLRVDVSLNGKNWTTLHSGICYFSGAGVGEPLIIPLDEKILGRHIRLSLSEHAPLHLAQVEVFVSRSVTNLKKLFDANGFEYDSIFHKIDPLKCFMPYELKSSSIPDTDGPLIGLSITRYARFGNNLSQTINAITLAKQLNLKYVRMFDFESFSLKEPVTVDGLTLLPPNSALPEGGCFLSGTFFYPSPFRNIISKSSEVEKYNLIQDIILPLMDIRELPRNTNKNELAIHIRSGDLFSKDVPHPDYVQPPVSFYKRIVTEMISSGRINKVCLVFEDRKNPCVDELEEYLTENSIDFRVQSGDLRDDIAALLNAGHMVFGFGSFGHAICRLSKTISTVYAYNDQGYAAFPNIEMLTIVTDMAGNYIKKGQWRRSHEQLKIMAEYPEANLRFDRIR